jgi:nascent polypeptide-associated complex subunit beta
MNAEKLKRLQTAVRTGGKGSVRRKRKVVHKQGAADDKKLQATFKRLKVNAIPGIEEVNLFKDDGNVIQFKNPKFQANFNANTYVVSGKAETKKAEEVIASVLTPEMLKNLAARLTTSSADGDVPDLVDNFEEVASRDDTKHESKELKTEAKRETKTEEPKKEETKTEEPKKEETKTEAKTETKTEEPKKEETKTEEPKKEETKTEAKTEEPKKEETKTEAKKEEPKKEETKTEEPKKEETTKTEAHN